MTYAIAAAGTGGHIYPALAVADELVAGGVAADDVTFIGGRRLAPEVVPAAGYDLVSVEMRGLKRSLSLSNLTLPAVVMRASQTIGRELAARSVTAVLAMGGYITIPALVAARRRGIPFILHEQNGRPGLANRIAAPMARRVLVAFPEAATRLRRAEVVGNPLRRSLVELDRTARRPAARRRYDLDADGLVVGVMGGSQGAVSLNDAIAAYAARRDRAPLIHLVGPAHAETMQRRAQGARIPWRIVPYESSMEDFYAACDLVVCRAGASTVSELAVTGTPSVLVPLEAVAQEHNASYLADRGAARIIRQARLEARLQPEIDALVSDRHRLREMADAARAAGRPEAAAVVAAALREVADG